MNTKEIGKIGEDLATEYLKNKGYKIITRNWGNKWGEIDIVCKSPVSNFQSPVTVFVEVKTKIGEDWGTPEAMVNKRKLFQVQRIASLYKDYRIDKVRPSQPKRVDVVAVVLNADLTVKRINHYEAVY